MSKRSQVALKVSIKLWHEWRIEMDYLRTEFSWNQLSKLHGHSERGWAASAYEHRGLLTESLVGTTFTLANKLRRQRQRDDAKVLDVLESVVTNGKEQPVTPQPSSMSTKAYDTVSEFKAIVTQIREKFGISMTSIGQHIGYASATGVSNIMNGHTNPSGTKLLRLRALAGKLDEGFDPAKQHPLTDLPDGPAPAIKGRDVRDSRPAGGGAYAWMDSVSEGLLALAEEIGQAALEVPAAFRGPYTEKQNKIMELAAEFER